MSLSLTVTSLLASIRRRASIPTTATVGTADSDLVRYINEELQLRLVADIMRVREEYFVQTQDYTISASTQRYRIPSRAIGNKVRAVYLVNGNGDLWAIPRIEPEHRDQYGGTGEAFGYLVEGNDLVLVPGSTTTAVTLRIKFYLRPAEVSTSAVQYTISSINTSTNTVTTSVNHGFTTSSSVDLLSSSPGNEVISYSLTPTATSSNTITFSSLPQTLATGDGVIAADTSVVPQIPNEFHHVLAQRVAVKVLEALGKLSEAQAAGEELRSMEANGISLISTRTDAQPKKIFTARGVLGPGKSGRLLWGGD